ncbi:helix-turn-helix domain-containing protein, partial [Geobacillus sp. DSP4a]|uniref:helix-turn-helix domain-containing protein n=1 Tax=Geobacillus sp. DSP4a TaxID=2508873 RepID=UPI002738D82B
DALKPKRRSDRGHSRRLSPDDEDHILALRKEHPTMPVTVFYERLIEQGEIPENHTSYFTIYRLLKKHNLVGKEKRRPLSTNRTDGQTSAIPCGSRAGTSSKDSRHPPSRLDTRP